MANTTSLSFSWRPSDGHVDAYDLSLCSVSEATANHRMQHQQVRRRLRSVVKLHFRASCCHHVVLLSDPWRAGGQEEGGSSCRRLLLLRPESGKPLPPPGGELEPRHEQRLVGPRQNRSVDMTSPTVPSFCLHFNAPHLLSSAVPAPVSALQVQSSGRSDRLRVSWQHGAGSCSSYQVNTLWLVFIHEIQTFKHIFLNVCCFCTFSCHSTFL